MNWSFLFGKLLPRLVSAVAIVICFASGWLLAGLIAMIVFGVLCWRSTENYRLYFLLEIGMLAVFGWCLSSGDSLRVVLGVILLLVPPIMLKYGTLDV